jgi:pimeloyl-ACP methyl ester carboxylesterase
MNEIVISSHFSFSLTVKFLTFIFATIVIVISLTLSQDHIVVAQPQQFLEDLSFNIDGVTFSHHVASVNGIQMHYVIGGQGDPLVLLHGWPQTWYEWRHIMPALAKKYTVIAPDLRGLGDSSKPLTGYDGKTTAEDIYQLISQLGFKQQILLVAHDIGSQTAYSFAAAHPDKVSKLVIMDFPFPGFIPLEFENELWWFAFHQTPNLPEAIVEGKEREYMSWFFNGLAYNPDAITEEDTDKYVSYYSSPGGMRAGFEYYRAFSQDAEDNKESAAMGKLTIPVLVLSGDIYPALGGDFPGNTTLNSTQALAENVKGVIVPYSGHWIPEEQPDFVIAQLSKFFGNSNNEIK